MIRKFNENMSSAAVNKKSLLDSGVMKYIISSAFAGAFVGIGIILTFTIGGILSPTGCPYIPMINGLSFSIALSFVIFTGTELFTGNNMVMAMGVFNKTVKVMDMIKIWVMSFIGNYVGAFIISGIYVGSGLGRKENIMAFFENAAINKATTSFTELFMRGILCNIMVCLAVIMCCNIKNETAKIIMCIMCIYPFVTIGFEHCVANMTVYTVSFLESGINGVTLMHFVTNMIPVTLGNIVGGAVIIGGGFYAIDKK